MLAAERYVSAILTVAGIIGAISSIAALFKGSLVYALTAAGYVGFVALFVGSIVVQFREDDDNAELIAGLVGVTVGAVCLVAFPFTEEEDANTFNVLSVIGIVAIVVFFVMLVDAYDKVKKAKEAEHKTCPECANSVLAAARKCQHCEYRFDQVA